MSTAVKTILWVLVIVIVIGGFGYYMSNKKAVSYNKDSDMEGSSTPVLTSGNSNDDLDRDISAIDIQLKSVDSDSQSVDQSFNDKPISQ